MNTIPVFQLTAYSDTSESFVSVRGSKHAQLIGKESLRIGHALTNPPVEGSCASLQFTSGRENFDPRRELYRLLSTPPVYSTEQLQEAEAAVARISSCKDEDLQIWAENLGADLSKFED
jgi:hypothetical protein